MIVCGFPSGSCKCYIVMYGALARSVLATACNCVTHLKALPSPLCEPVCTVDAACDFCLVMQMLSKSPILLQNRHCTPLAGHKLSLDLWFPEPKPMHLPFACVPQPPLFPFGSPDVWCARWAEQHEPPKAQMSLRLWRRGQSHAEQPHQSPKCG